ncbi:MAG TPA: CPBP family intramembrane glutamic endopeptidase, partial [Candidatus Elarobacter sp.]|nr:CPBP family intramembrane glutamic endopeptidase [Candidatus Elarobacter sp.]
RRWGWLLGITLIGALGAKAIALYVGAALGVYAIAAPSTVPVGGALGGALLLALASTLLPSIAEDIVTRGVWYRVGPRSWTGARFVIASSLIYVLNHIYRLANGPTEWIMLFAFGLAYATALVRTRTLWAAIGLHWGWNLSSALLPLVADVTVLRADISPYVSAGAHLVMLGAVVVLTRRSEVHAEPAAA